MSTESAYTEPTKIASGSTITWTKGLALYPDGPRTLGYKIVGSGGVVAADVSFSGSVHTVTLTATGLPSGIYRLVGWVENAGGEKTVIYEQAIEVTPNLIDAATPIETRNYWQQLLEAINAITLNRASVIQKSMTTPGAGGRSIEYLSGDELYKWQKRCEHEIRESDERERRTQGKKRRKILIRFT